ncbi:DUF952 domain-containing protein [Pseudenhygromyxa sp. WMMC2535]|uniref:DUF952 domain-containing protein n=1 Tax=Pseudenhygromyxa sp. WMMC2535 TaxID=2712867 RepID=UPI00155570B0|nr:DUF952 domain-containing protein [Pseudenhygromyxa sp. WMMC2535]
MTELLYRICTVEDWGQACAEGTLPLSALDERDGFVHLSLAGQVAQTLGRYFTGISDLVLLTIDSGRLSKQGLYFEHSIHEDQGARRKGLFPHYYGRIAREAVVRAQTIERDVNGAHVLPAAVSEDARREFERELGTSTLELQLSWDDRGVALLEYPQETRIEDEASMLAWEAQLERRIAALNEGRGKVPLVVGVDNLWVAPKLERRYVEMVDKLITRAFSVVVRWSSNEHRRRFFARTNQAHDLPSEVFASREEAIGFALAQG